MTSPITFAVFVAATFLSLAAGVGATFSGAPGFAADAHSHEQHEAGAPVMMMAETPVTGPVIDVEICTECDCG